MDHTQNGVSEPSRTAGSPTPPDSVQPPAASPITSINSGYTGLASSIINTHGVINLSSHTLSEAEISLLSKGLSFCPCPGPLDLSSAMSDLDKFHRSLRLAIHFQEMDAQASSIDPQRGDPFSHRNFRVPSSWQPRGPPVLESFILSNYVAANKLPVLYKRKANLTLPEKEALKNLSQNRTIIIKPADKGSGVVLLNTKDYVFEAHRQLQDTNFYQNLDTDLTQQFADEINELILNMFNIGEIDSQCYCYLEQINPKPGRFYMLPKKHKNTLPSPGRPIVSAIRSPTEKISAFIDHFLQPLLPYIPSFIKDTSHFLQILDNLPVIPEQALLATLDVTSLYTNIPLSEAKTTIEKVLTESRSTDEMPKVSSLIAFLDLVFSRNIFTFSTGKTLEYYLQTNGVSMGSKCAPSVACLYMADFEKRFVYPYVTQPLLWKRYIDDIFIIWTHGDTALDAFVAYLNNCHSSIKFTVTKSTTSVDFLDLTVKKTTNGISTELFIKPTSSLAYLHRNSCHPRHVFTSLPYGEFLRVRRNCSDNASFDLYAARLKQAFCNRGYDPQEIQTALDKARTQDRTQLLSKGLPTDILPLVSEKETNDEAEPSTPGPSFLVLTHHPENQVFRQIISNNWDLLGASDTTRYLYDAGFKIGSRRNRRLRDILVHSSIPLPNKRGKQGKRIN